MAILSYFTRHPTLANILLIIMLAAGLLVLPNMRTQFFPDVVVESISVNVVWEGAGADDVDQGIAALIEPALLAVNGVSDVRTTSREGRVTFQVEFQPGWDQTQADQDVRTALDVVTGLPENAEDPVIRRGLWWDRVTDVIISGPLELEQLALSADLFVARLFEQGVTSVSVRGVAAPGLLVDVSASALLRHDISLQQIAEALRVAANGNPAGDLTGRSARLRIGEAERAAQRLMALPLRQEVTGGQLLLGDVAHIYSLEIDRDRAYFVGEQSAISIRVDRSPQGDAVAIQRIVERVAQELEAELPQGSSVELIRSRAEGISARIWILIENGLYGLGLVVILLFLFLNARTAFWVAAGIPVAMLSAVALMYAAGLTLNMISLFALIITLGIVVDDAIVVGEHADYRYRTYGDAPKSAAENAAMRMFKPVLAATLTTVIAFLALLAVGGRFGTFVADIPVTVAVVLLASLVECFLILPHHMAGALAASAKERWYDWPSRQVNRVFLWFRDKPFAFALEWLMRARYVVVACMIFLLASQAAALLRGDVAWRFINFPESDTVSVNFSMLDAAQRSDTLEMMHAIQKAARAVGETRAQESGLNPVLYVLGEVGGNSGGRLASAEFKTADFLGAVTIQLADADLRGTYSSQAFIRDMREQVQRSELVEELSYRGWRSGPSDGGLEIQLSGGETDRLKAAATALKQRLSAFELIGNLEDDLVEDKDEIILSLTPLGEALGFRRETLASEVRARLSGLEAVTFPIDGRMAEIRVELSAQDQTADQLEAMLLPAPNGDGFVPLAEISTMRLQSGFSTIRRENGQRLVRVTGEMSREDAHAASDMDRIIAEEILPDIQSDFQVMAQLDGAAANERAFLSDALVGLIACLIGIYGVLAWVLASWLRPLVIMAVIPFGLVGAIYGHGVWDVPLSMFSVIGLLGMTGIIINDSIVLVTATMAQLQKRAIGPAVLSAAQERLRPVVLTTLTTVLGLAPLLYESSVQAQFLRPTVITLVYGLGFGMVIVLFLVPALFLIGQDIAQIFASTRRAYKLLFRRLRRV